MQYYHRKNMFVSKAGLRDDIPSLGRLRDIHRFSVDIAWHWPLPCFLWRTPKNHQGVHHGWQEVTSYSNNAQLAGVLSICFDDTGIFCRGIHLWHSIMVHKLLQLCPCSPVFWETFSALDVSTETCQCVWGKSIDTICWVSFCLYFYLIISLFDILSIC